MRTKCLKDVVLSIFVITLLVMSVIAVASTLSTSSVSASSNSLENIVRGKETAFNINQVGAPPWVEYKESPLNMVAKRVGRGGVLAGGVSSTCRNGRWNGLRSGPNPYPYFDKLLDVAFQWMKPGAKNVIWYEGHNVYNTVAQCSELVAALQDLGYTIAPTSAKLTDIGYAAFDILVIPQMQEGTPGTGGDPTKITDAEVAAVRTFVEGGGGLLIMEASDFGGYNFNKVQNKVLEGLGFDYFFQDDQVSDETNNWGGAAYQIIADVDTTTDIGAAYENATGASKIGLYSTCSMAKAGPGVVAYILPEFQVGMPGSMLNYSVTVLNPVNPLAVDLTGLITINDNKGWKLTLENESLFIPKGENRKTAFSVTIPAGENMGTEDVITLTVEASGHPEIRSSFTCRAYAAMRIEPTDDAYVYEKEPDVDHGGDYRLPIGRYDQWWQWDYLQFDLSAIPSGQHITDARLCLFCYYQYAPGFNVLCHEVDDDWTEGTIIWNDKPTPGDILDTKFVSMASYDSPKPYFWNVTSFVRREFAGDKIASFCLRPPDNLPEATSRAFYSKEGFENRTHPFLMVTTGALPPYGVDVSISPDNQSGVPGGTVTFTVTITNTGTNADSYNLMVEDTRNWSLELSDNHFEDVAPNGSRVTTLSVTIPETAKGGDSSTITVTASDGATGSDICRVTAITPLSVSISPREKSGKAGETLTYTVTVQNTGGVEDTFSLSASATAGWSLNISPSSLTIPAGDSKTAALSVTIPETAKGGDSSTITVTASDGATGSDTCTAKVAGGISMILLIVIVVIIVVIIGVVLVIKH